MSRTAMKPAAPSTALLPRFIRLRDTAFYLGMDRNRFNAEVRPYLTKIPIGRQGIAFDRLEPVSYTHLRAHETKTRISCGGVWG